MVDIQYYINLSDRDKAIMMGLFLSRFDKVAMQSLGFNSFKQAYNLLGYSVGIKPSSINNYRDEFDPYFDNGRQGWHNRDIKPHCKVVMEKAKDLTFEDFYTIIKYFISDDSINLCDQIVNDTSSIQDHKQFANRLMTGKAAEKYFVKYYNDIYDFSGSLLQDTTLMGCGFDFKLSLPEVNYYVEVKGMNGKTGNVLLTEREYEMAYNLKDKYCLFVVRNFKDKPFHDLYFDPLNRGQIHFIRQEEQIIRTTYNGKFIQDLV